MANINTNNTKNTVELRTELNANGIQMENVYVNGTKFCCVGYVSAKDKEDCLKAIQTAVNSSKDLYDAMQKLMTIANFGDNNVSPDKEIEVCNMNVFISYANKCAYDGNGNEICDCRELTCDLPDEAIEAILMPRIEKIIEDSLYTDWE